MTLVLLHPLPLDSLVWPPEIRTLGESIAPTLYDFGDDIVDWARGALDVAPSGPLDLVGNSVGGSCALEIAYLAPDRVRSIVLIGAKAGVRPEPEFRDEALRVLAEDGIDAAWRRYWASLFAPDADQSLVARGHDIARSVGAAAVARGVKAFHNRPDRHAFAVSLDVPILMLAGTHDIDPGRAEAFAKQLRCGRFREIKGAGHYAPLEKPDALAQALVEFQLAR